MRRTTAKQDGTGPRRIRKKPDPDVAATYSIAEASARLGIGTSTGYALAARDEFPVRIVTIGATKKVLKADLEQFLAGLAGQAV